MKSKYLKEKNNVISDALSRASQEVSSVPELKLDL